VGGDQTWLAPWTESLFTTTSSRSPISVLPATVPGIAAGSPTTGTLVATWYSTGEAPTAAAFPNSLTAAELASADQPNTVATNALASSPGPATILLASSGTARYVIASAVVNVVCGPAAAEGGLIAAVTVGPTSASGVEIAQVIGNIASSTYQGTPGNLAVTFGSGGFLTNAGENVYLALALVGVTLPAIYYAQGSIVFAQVVS
jgi:hypothetical protein